MSMRLVRFALLFPWMAQLAHSQGITVVVSPAMPSIHIGTSQQFTAKVTGAANTAVTWSISGTGAIGSINVNNGTYTPPGSLPTPNTVTVTATTIATPTATGTATITLLNPFPFLASVIPAPVPVGSSTLTMNGSGFVPGAQVTFGGAVLPTTYVSTTRLTANVTTTQAQVGQVAVTVTDPDPGSAVSNMINVQVGSSSGSSVSAGVANRFLDQAAFGADSITSTHVQQVGLQGYLDEQFAASISPYQDPATIGTSLGPVQARFFTNAVHGQDQLRQRVAFALSQIFVVSGIVLSQPARMVPFLQILQNDAFGNYLTLMTDVTLSPSMGDYLNMVNNDKANAARGTLPNENYARELLQLFTIGTALLNQDGTLQFDSMGHTIPTYTQTTVTELSRVFTGWTYPTQPGHTLLSHNPAYYAGPMVPYQPNHDTGSKALLNGVTLSMGQTAEKDLADALNNIFNHPNVGPFVCKNLIEHLVTSNPSSAYVTRVSAVFANNGSGVRGDLKAVVQQILMDPEARQGDPPSYALPNAGHLREPVLFIASLLRGLGAQVNDTNNLAAQGASMGQNVFYSPSVFNYYSPNYHISGTPLLGPEFQLDTPTTTLTRANFVNTLVYANLGQGAVVSLTPFVNLAANPDQLVDAVNAALVDGSMPYAIRQQILAGVTGQSTNLAKAQAAVYLVGSSSYYALEH